MLTRLRNITLNSITPYADWQLLAFLVLFLDVKIAIKLLAIALLFALNFNFRFGLKLKGSRLPLFYLIAPAIAVCTFIFTGAYHTISYSVLLLTGIGFWLMCLLASHQIKLRVEQTDTEKLHRTITLFFVLNAIISALNIALIIFKIREPNPYTYQGQHQLYFISTGDYIRGITFDTSTTNAILNAFGVVYFLSRRQSVMLIVCMAVLLLTGSNFINITLILVLLSQFIFNSTRAQKSLITVCVAMLVVFMTKISPQNNKYTQNTIRHLYDHSDENQVHRPPVSQLPLKLRPDSVLNTEERHEKFAMLYLDSLGAAIAKRTQKQVRIIKADMPITESGRLLLPEADINSDPYQSLDVTPTEQLPLVGFIRQHAAFLPISGSNNYSSNLPGKAVSLMQTATFFRHHPMKLIAGDGMGNFSSKLAFRATGLGFAGGYPQRFVYINPDFLKNHLDVYLNFFSKRSGYHSLTNSPFSVYDQLLSEYGLLGLLSFLIFYLGFFAHKYKLLTYGIPLLIIMCAAFFIDYWFEQLSVVVFFELLLFVNMKENIKPTTDARPA